MKPTEKQNDEQLEKLQQEYDDRDDEDFEDEPDYFLCYSCGHSTTINHAGWGCPRCTAIMSPEYY